MVKNKGIGYIIEAFVSSLVVMVFVFSSFSSISSPQKDWTEFRDRVSAHDSIYALQKSGKLERIIQNGDLASFSEVGDSMTTTTLSMSGTISGPPTGSYTIGIFTDEDQIRRADIRKLESSDKCSGDLEEINSEFDIFRTESGTFVDNKYNSTVYFADSDPRKFGKYNGVPDYDTYFVDVNQRCQFTDSEGPFNFGSYITLENKTQTTYEVNNVSISEKKAILYESDLSRKIKTLVEEYPSADFKTDNLNFSGSIESTNMLVFVSNSSLDDIENNEARFMDYSENNPVLLSMDLNKTAIRNGVIKKAGYSYVNLSLTFSAKRKPEFTNSTVSSRIENYMRTMGYDLDSIELYPSKISSESGGRINPNPVIQSSNFEYDTSGWNVVNDSMEDAGTYPVGLPDSECPDPHKSGIFDIPVRNNYREVTGFTTKLDGTSSDCNILGFSIDKDNDGDIEDNEKVFLDGDRTEINGRKYEIRIIDEKHVELTYIGESKLAYLNSRQEMENQEAEKIGRIPEINENSSEEKIALMVSTSLLLLEGEKRFGSEPDEGVAASAPLLTKNGIYNLNTRWER